MKTAREIMRRDVVTVTPDTRLREAAELMLSRRISGLLVADRQGRLLGVLSQTDLVRESRAPEAERIPAFFTEQGRVFVAPKLSSAEDVPVSQVMTPVVFSADQDTPVPELARFMLRRGIHRVIITRDGELAGIVTSIDMLRLVASQGGRRRAGPWASRRRPRAARAHR